MRIPVAVWAIGLVSLFMDMASEMVHALLPLFLTSLGATALDVGIIEGVAESSALMIKVFSGTISDRLGKRKALAVIGYAMGALSKPMIAMAHGGGMVLFARLIDRLGKGVRGAPRDALVADVCAVEIRGRAYGLRQTLDAIGSFLGPLCVVVLLWLVPLDFRMVFWIATIPAVLSVLILIIGVQDVKNVAKPDPSCAGFLSLHQMAKLGVSFWSVVVVGGILTLARFSEAFLILRAEIAGIPLAELPLVMVVMNMAYAVTAYPFGRLSDRIGAQWLLVIGLMVLMAADICLALVENVYGIWLGVVLWGVHFGITQGLLAKLVADSAPSELRGTAFGVFNLICGLALLLASVIAGWVWQNWNWSGTFKIGAACSLVAILALFLIAPRPVFRTTV